MAAERDERRCGLAVLDRPRRDPGGVDTGLADSVRLPTVWPVNLARPGTPVGDDNGHGTGMAFIAVGRRFPAASGTFISGIAPGAAIMPVQVADAAGRTGPRLLAGGAD